jgi:selenocysteine lyase/cysteine desulfurase
MDAQTTRTPAGHALAPHPAKAVSLGAARKIDVDLARARTPGLAAITHLNNAGAALMSERVLNTAIEHLKLEALVGGYEAADRAKARMFAVYRSTAALLGCAADEIAIMENASRAWALFFASLELKAGDVVVTTEAEYASNFMSMLQARRRCGIEIEVIPPAEDGAPDPAALRRLIDRRGARIRLVSLTHVATNNGAISPIETLSRIVREARGCGALAPNALVAVDACQTVGQMDVNVDALGCDMLTATSRKFLRGPRGVGILYVRRALPERAAAVEPRILDMRSGFWSGSDEYRVYAEAERFETWDKCVASKLAFGTAVDEALDWGLDAIEASIGELSAVLREMLAEVPGVRLCDTGSRQCGTVTFDLERGSPYALVTHLREHDINIGVSDRDLVRLDMDRRNLEAVARCSVHYYNTVEDLERFIAATGRYVRST